MAKTHKRCPFHYRGLECKSRKSRNTWSNRQIWPWPPGVLLALLPSIDGDCHPGAFDWGVSPLLSDSVADVQVGRVPGLKAESEAGGCPGRQAVWGGGGSKLKLSR